MGLEEEEKENERFLQVVLRSFGLRKRNEAIESSGGGGGGLWWSWWVITERSDGSKAMTHKRASELHR